MFSERDFLQNVKYKKRYRPYELKILSLLVRVTEARIFSRTSGRSRSVRGRAVETLVRGARHTAAGAGAADAAAAANPAARE